ncbi:MAG: VOC family protein [Kiloniellales bacterium]|nr:VOC family protein [Kiloniellales bacterium]
MALIDLDHVNIRTANLAAMTMFYQEVLGLEIGPRPDFRFDGAWLYCGEKAAVHLVEVPETPQGRAPRIEHFAFKANGLEDFLSHLKKQGIGYRISIVPGPEIRQVNIHDPDGNHIEVAFPASEEADLSDYAST